MASDDERDDAWFERAHRNSQRQWKEYKAGRRRKLPDEFEHVYREVMGLFEQEWQASKNPLYVWQAISFATSPVTDLYLPLPGWCRRYLAEAAYRIAIELRKAHPSLGVVRSPPEPHHGDDAARSAAEWNDLVLRALGFRRDGSNAYTEYAASYRRERLQRQFSELLANGLSRRAARDVILREMGRYDDRELRRLLKDVQAPPSSKEEGELGGVGSRKGENRSRLHPGGRHRLTGPLSSHSAVLQGRPRSPAVSGNAGATMHPKASSGVNSDDGVPRAAGPGTRQPLAQRIPDASSLSGLSRSAIYRAAARGQIVLLKHGRTTLVDMASLRAFLAGLPHA